MTTYEKTRPEGIAAVKAGRQGTARRLVIPQGQQDMAALKSAIDGWIVSVLVEKFLASSPMSGGRSEVISDVLTSQAIGKEAR